MSSRAFLIAFLSAVVAATYGGDTKAPIANLGFGAGPVPVANLEIDNAPRELEVGSSWTLYAVTLEPKGAHVATTARWTSDSPAIAAVVDGHVVALAPGSVTITATVGSIVAKTTLSITDPRADGAAKTLGALETTRVWRIAVGSFAADSDTVSLTRATARPCADAKSQDCDGFFPTAFNGGVKLWPSSSLPIAVVIDHAASTSNVSAKDSSRLWSALDSISAAMGVTMFKPADPSTIAIAAGKFTTGTIIVTVDSTIRYAGGETEWLWNARDEITAARVRLKLIVALGNPALVQHEFIHALGFKHTCAWPSPMGGYGCPAVTITHTDVAYIQLAEAMRDAESLLRDPSGALPRTALGGLTAAAGQRMYGISAPR